MAHTSGTRHGLIAEIFENVCFRFCFCLRHQYFLKSINLKSYSFKILVAFINYVAVKLENINGISYQQFLRPVSDNELSILYLQLFCLNFNTIMKQNDSDIILDRTQKLVYFFITSCSSDVPQYQISIHIMSVFFLLIFPCSKIPFH